MTKWIDNFPNAPAVMVLDEGGEAAYLEHQKRDSMFFIRRLAEGGTSEQQRRARNILNVGYDGTVEKGGKREILRAAQEGRELEITDGVLGYERRKADIRRQWWTLVFAAFAAFGASYSVIAQIYDDVSAKIEK